MQDVLAGFLAEGSAVRGLAVDVTSAAEQTRLVHGLGPDATRAATECLAAAALMSAYLKGDQRVTLQVQAERPRFSFVADVWADGRVRARLTPPDLRAREGDVVDGVLLAIKIDAGQEVFRGATAIEGTRVEEALVSHLATSSQVDATVRLQALLDETGEVRSAGGALVERLPSHPELPSLTTEEFHARFVPLPPLPELMAALEAGRLVQSEAQLTEERPVRWQCSCDLGRVEAMLAALGADDLESLHAEQGQAEVSCHFCCTTYTVPGPRLLELVRSLRSPEPS